MIVIVRCGVSAVETWMLVGAAWRSTSGDEDCKYGGYCPEGGGVTFNLFHLSADCVCEGSTGGETYLSLCVLRRF